MIYKVCSNVILGGTVFKYFDYFMHRMIIGTPVKFLSVIFTVGALGIWGRQPACEILGHITFSSLQFKNTSPPIKIESVSKSVPSLGTY